MRERKKILLVLPSLSGGGAERVMLTLSKFLNREVFEVYLVVIIKKGAYIDIIPDNVSIIYFNSSRVRYSFIKMIRLILDIKPKFVFSTLGQFNLMMAFIRLFISREIKFIGRESNTVSVRNKDMRFPKIYNKLYKLLYPNLDLVICQSEYMRKDLIYNYGFPESKAVVINNPVDTEEIEKKMDIDVGFPLQRNKINLLAVGRLVNQKGFDLLLASFSLLDTRYVLTILGEGPLEVHLKKMAIDLNISERINFEGFVNNPYAYMKGADIFVLSSRYEGFPNVVLEANACGLPVIAFDSPGGVREILGAGVGGELVPNGDVRELAQRILNFDFSKFSPAETKAVIKTNYCKARIIKMYEDALLGML